MSRAAGIASRPGHDSRGGGFTLIEVLVALVIVAVGHVRR